MKYALFHEHQEAWIVLGICDNTGETLVDQVLELHENSEPGGYARMMAILQHRVPQSGPHLRGGISKKLRDGIFRFARADFRVFWFYGPEPKHITCTHAWLRDKDYENQINRALDLRKQFIQAHEASAVERVHREPRVIKR